jgi:hypothetical protein
VDSKAISDLRELESKATPRLWDYDAERIWDDHNDGTEIGYTVYPAGNEDAFIADCRMGKDNARLIAAMRNALPELLDAAENAAIDAHAVLAAAQEREKKLRDLADAQEDLLVAYRIGGTRGRKLADMAIDRLKIAKQDLEGSGE